MKHLSLFIATAWLFLHIRAAAQDSAALTFSGYTELYYGYDAGRPPNHEKPFFLYNHKRHNEVNVNLAYAKADYSTPRLRSNLAFMVGTYAQYNLAAEPEIFRFVYEANIGVKLSRNRNLWLDAGVMPSHIGFESAVSADCWTASRSLVAENSPYYETGLKLTSTNKKENFVVSLLLLNGWQRIHRPAGTSKPSFGLQLHYKYSDNLTLNYSNFTGTDKPDTAHALRLYHDIYAIYTLQNWGLIAGFDAGRDKDTDNKYAWWYAPVLIVRRHLTKNTRLAVRGEYFSDKKQVILATNTPNGFQTWGLSFNYDYNITQNALARIEGRGFFSADKIFRQQQANNYSLLLTISLKL